MPPRSIAPSPRSRAAWTPQKGRAERAPRAPSHVGVRVFRVAVALYIVVTVTRIHEVVPGLAYLRPGKLLILPLVASALFALPRWQLLSPLRTTTAKSIGVIIVLAAFGVPLAIWPSNSTLYLVNALIPMLLLFIGASIAFVDRDTAKLCMKVLVICVGADALYLIAGRAPLVGGRPYIGIGLGPNESAALFVLAFPFAIAMGSGRGRMRWLGFAIAGLLAAGVMKTGSRGGIIGLAVVALALIARAGPRRRLTYLVAVAACGLGAAFTADDMLIERIATITQPHADYNVTDSEGRLQIWTRGLGYMASHPVLGIGLNNFETAEGVLSGKINQGYGIRYTAAHNAFVQIGAELGLVGLVAFVVALWSAARGCLRVLRAALRDHAARPRLADDETRLATAALCALLGVATTGFFLSLAYHPIMFFALATCIGVRVGSPYEQRLSRR
jgi:O-antigen ligase